MATKKKAVKTVKAKSRSASRKKPARASKTKLAQAPTVSR